MKLEHDIEYVNVRTEKIDVHFTESTVNLFKGCLEICKQKGGFFELNYYDESGARHTVQTEMIYLRENDSG